MSNISNTINRYDNMLYESRPTSINEFLSNKYNNVHNELYNNALNKYIYEIIDKYINYDFIYNFYQYISLTSYNSYDNIDSTLKNILNKLSIDYKVCINVLYDITEQKLNEVKDKLVNYYEDDNGQFLSIIETLSSISEIKDFRFLYYDDIELVSLESSQNNIITIKPKNNRRNSSFNFLNELVGSEENSNNINNDYNKYVFVYEFKPNGIIIGYNRYGEWLLVVDTNSKFRDIEKIPDLKSHIEKYMKIKSKGICEIYKEAICKLYKKYHKIVEIKQSEYWMPSSIFIINKISPYTKTVVDLSKYWNMIQRNEIANIDDIKISNENLKDFELVELNYVSGKAIIQSRIEDIVYEVPFKYLNENINISDDMILSNSFVSKYNEL